MKKKMFTMETNREEDLHSEERNTIIDQTQSLTAINSKKNQNSTMAEINLLEVNFSDLQVKIQDTLEAKVKMLDSNLLKEESPP